MRRCDASTSSDHASASTLLDLPVRDHVDTSIRIVTEAKSLDDLSEWLEPPTV
jgi:hypothetical protein